MFHIRSQIDYILLSPAFKGCATVEDAWAIPSHHCVVSAVCQMPAKYGHTQKAQLDAMTGWKPASSTESRNFRSLCVSTCLGCSSLRDFEHAVRQNATNVSFECDRNLVHARVRPDGETFARRRWKSEADPVARKNLRSEYLHSRRANER